METLNLTIKELRVKLDGLAQLVRSLDKPILMISNDIKADDIDDFIDDYKMRGGIISVPITSQAEYVGPSLSFISESYKSLLLAKAWLGKVLAELGEETPYKNEGNRKTVEDIEPTADRFKVPELIQFPDGKGAWNDHNYIEKIDWLREEIKKVFEDFSNVGFTFQKMAMNNEYRLMNICHSSLNYLTEARFFLGFEISRIKEQSK